MTKINGTKHYSFEWVALDKHVLLVKVDSDDLDNGVYIGAVEAKDYEKEVLDVVVNGSAVWTMFAAAYFKNLGKSPKWLFHEHPFREEEQANRFFDKTTSQVTQQSHHMNIIEVLPLDKHVLAVAVGYPHDEWGAYIGAVKGEDYDTEVWGVVENGSQIPFEPAWLLFRNLGKLTEHGDIKWREIQEEHIQERDVKRANS